MDGPKVISRDRRPEPAQKMEMQLGENKVGHHELGAHLTQGAKLGDRILVMLIAPVEESQPGAGVGQDDSLGQPTVSP